MRPTAGRLISLIGIAAIVAAGCSSDPTESSATTPESSVVAAASTAPSSAAPPTTEDAPATTAVPSTQAPDTASTDAPQTTMTTGGEVTVLVPSPDLIELRDGEVVRFETEFASFELTGKDGWSAYVTPLSVWMTPVTAYGQAFISIAHLKDGRAELGANGSDRNGVAIAADPFISPIDFMTPDGTLIYESYLGLPDDWFAYIATLPGLTVGDVAPMSISGIEGEGATYSVGDVPEAPDATCSNGVMSWVELAGGWCFTERESGTLLITEIGGERYELNVGAMNDVAPLDQASLEEIVASLVLV